MATKSKKSSSKRKSVKQTEKENNARRQMWAVILFALGVLFGALALIKGVSAWKVIHDFMFGLFGWGGFLISPLLIYISVVIAREKTSQFTTAKLWETFILIALICGAVQIFSIGVPDKEGFFASFIDLYMSGVALKGGGLCAGLIGIPLLLLFGKTGAAIIIVLLIFVFAMLITGSTLMGLFTSASKPMKKLEQVYTERVTEERRAPAKFNIDIPLDEPIMPEHPVKSPKSTTQGTSSIEKSKERLLDSMLGTGADPTSTGAPAPSPAIPATPAVSAVPPIPPDLEIAPLEPVPPAIEIANEPVIPAAEVPEETSYINDIINKFIISDDSFDVDGEFIDDLVEQENSEPRYTEGDLKEIPPQEILDKAALPPVYAFPPINLLSEAILPNNEGITEELKANAQRLVDTLQSFGVQTRIVDICRGPAVTRYELQPSAGVKISKITGLADDIALNLAAAGVRIEAPIPNKAAVGIEVPNKIITTVAIREIIDSNEFVDAKSRLTTALGKDITGNIALADIAKMPHMLIAGSTGSGKSVCINSIIMSLLFKSSPDEVKFLMIDPKVVELGVYNGIPHLLVPVVTDPKKAAGALGWAVTEMLNRYKAFAANSVRDLASYNALAATKDDLHPMPQIVIIIDELADLMMAAPNEVEDSICRLAQMARAAGMHLVIATQRPSVDVITGVIKANIPSRIAFAVSSQIDSRTILDMGGAEKLLGRGDMLYYPVGASKPLRVQGCFVSDKEIEKVISFIKEGEKTEYDQQIIEEIDKQAVVTGNKKGDKGDGDGGGFSDDDEMLPAAIECVIEAGQASTSLLQRRLKLGYARAARIIDEMEMRGIVGPFEGSKPRQVLMSKDRWIEMKLNQEQ